MKIRKRLKRSLVLLAVTILLLIMLLPFYLMFMTSLKTLPEILAPEFKILPKNWLFSNYAEAMRRGAWPRYLLNSLVVTSVTVGISLIINSLAGYGFARIPFYGRDTLFFFALVGMMVPAQVTMISVFVILKNFPLVGGNSIWGSGGTGLINTYAGLILPYIAGPFGVFLCRQFYLNFPSSLDDAAKVDGCSRITAYARIYLPLSKPILATLAVLKATQTWNDYMWPLIMVNKEDMMTAQVAVVAKFASEVTIYWQYLMAATTIIILPLFILFLFTQKYFVEGIVTTGMKG